MSPQWKGTVVSKTKQQMRDEVKQILATNLSSYIRPWLITELIEQLTDVVNKNYDDAYATGYQAGYDTAYVDWKEGHQV